MHLITLKMILVTSKDYPEREITSEVLHPLRHPHIPHMPLVARLVIPSLTCPPTESVFIADMPL